MAVAAQLNDLRTALVRLGFSVDGAVDITADQGLDTLDEIKLLTDVEVSDLCKALRRPGGQIINPNAVGANPAMIANPGVQVSLRAETNLKLACYYLRFRDRISRAVASVDVTLPNIRALRALRDSEKEYKQPTDAPDVDEKYMITTIDNIESYLGKYVGDTKVPLSYVIRDDPEVIPEADDPPENYETRQSEMVARAPHTDAAGNPDPVFVQDNHTVWDIIADICKTSAAWRWIRAFERTKDGRGAYQELIRHYLGASAADNMNDEAKRILTSTFYTKEGRRFTYEKYVQRQKDAHVMLQRLEKQGYAELDEREKVRYLIDGIKNDKLDGVKTTIWANPALRRDFDGCVDLFRTSLKHATQSNPNVNISSFESGGRGRGGRGGRGRGRDSRNYRRHTAYGDGGGRDGGGRGRGRGRGRGGGRGRGPVDGSKIDITDRYYTNDEFEAIGPEGRSQVMKLREARDQRRKASSTTTTSAIAVEDVARMLCAFGSGNANNNSFEADDTAKETQQPSNRSNPALRRPDRSTNQRGTGH
jgi:hypothetical protein